jgi:hypothetical protein
MNAIFRGTLAALLVTAALPSSSSGAAAVVILSNNAGTTTLGGSGYEGHSFTVPADSAYNKLTFSWISSNRVTRLAAGNLFLLTQEYLSTPAGLSSATPGFVAESITVASSAYVFSPSVTINPSTQYWVYMGDDASLAGGGYIFSNPFAGGKAYEQFSSPFQNYFNNGASLDFNFVLSGEPVPEPAAWCLAALGLTCLARRCMAARVTVNALADLE